MKFSISEINQILGNINFNGSVKSNLYFSKVSIDSRTISPQDLFIALKGQNFDGHDFLKNVLKIVKILKFRQTYNVKTQSRKLCVGVKITIYIFSITALISVSQ